MRIFAMKKGVNTLGVTGGSDLSDNDSRVTWAWSLALALRSELALVAWGAQGYTVSGLGGVPPLFTPSDKNDSSASAFAWIDSNHGN